MSIETVLLIVALILSIIEELRARGQSLICYAVILVCIALLWGRLSL